MVVSLLPPMGAKGTKGETLISCESTVERCVRRRLEAQDVAVDRPCESRRLEAEKPGFAGRGPVTPCKGGALACRGCLLLAIH